MSNVLDLKYRPSRNDFIFEYHIEPIKKFTFDDAATFIANELGGNTARVYFADFRSKRIKIAFSKEVFEKGNIPQLVNAMTGTVWASGFFDRFKIIDFSVPTSYFKQNRLFNLRKKLNFKDHVLSTSLQMNSNLDESEKYAYDLWTSGIDVIEDRLNTIYQTNGEFLKKIDRMLISKKKAEEMTKKNKMFIPNITNTIPQMNKWIYLLKKVNMNFFMVNSRVIGIPALMELAKNSNAVILTRGGILQPKNQFSEKCEIKIAQLIGIDMIEVSSKSDCKSNITLNVTGGIHPSKLFKLKSKYENACFYAYRAVWEHPDGYKAGALALRKALDIKKIYESENHHELLKAIHKWG